MTEIIVKILLLSLIIAPFLALWSDMMCITVGLMTRVVDGVAIILAIALLFGGFHDRYDVAKLAFAAFCAWPLALLITKKVRPAISWLTLWLSVPVMSWFLVNLMISLTNGFLLSGFFGLMLGWIYMLIPFGILSLLLIGFQALMRRIRKSGNNQGPTVSP